MAITLKIFDSNQSTLAKLGESLGDCPSLELLKTEKVLYLRPPSGLDVLYLPLSVTIERWRAKSLIHESQVLPTSISEQEDGLPQYIVTGTCLAENDPRGPIPETSLLVSAVFRAIREFNRENDNRIMSVGFWAVDLLRMVNAGELRMILAGAVPELGLK